MEKTRDSFRNRVNAAATQLAMPEEDLIKVLADLGAEENDPNVLELFEDPEIKRTLFGTIKSQLPNAKDLKLRSAISILLGSKKAQPDDRLTSLKTALGISADSIGIEHVELDKLLQNYTNPADPHDLVTQELKRRFKEQAVILFKDGNIAVDETIEYAMSIAKGMEPMDCVDVDGEPVEPVAVGIVPDQLLEEDPMFVGHALWKGKSRKNGVDYSKIDIETRQFLRILVERKELDPNKKMEVYSIIGSINAAKADIKSMFAHAYIEFKKRRTDHSLPTLVIRQSDIVRMNNPFGNRSR